MYREWRSRLVGAMVWERRAPVHADVTRVLPDGCMDLIWYAGRLLTAGPDTRAQLCADLPGAMHTGLRFAPGVGPAVFGMPASELRDQRVPLDEVWPAWEAERLAERIAATPQEARGRLLEEAVARRLPAGPLGGGPLRDGTLWGGGGPSPLPSVVAKGLRAGGTVAAVARDVGLSERQLHRKCVDAFGYGPKMLARVFRMGRALELARSGVPLVQVAVRAGYADQAHLAREIRALAGTSVTELLAAA
ncbi:helix-turn-helix transcriptional regulator [Streptomyces zagrosensis]|uniref:AraC-like DNA-binding protein n=1 Tax=Streptomyces zagrosensis TaxID=1042984 RepID=A0A7W9Q685_9ACTN|nr:helix-turn-helix transcriptional regulator [Streptomyces zagrosensis]MBB5934149.1 AraC-like DNA-binding protein [Streptomyces zagrosensis]